MYNFTIVYIHVYIYIYIYIYIVFIYQQCPKHICIYIFDFFLKSNELRSR